MHADDFLPIVTAQEAKDLKLGYCAKFPTALDDYTQARSNQATLKQLVDACWPQRS